MVTVVLQWKTYRGPPNKLRKSPEQSQSRTLFLTSYRICAERPFFRAPTALHYSSRRPCPSTPGRPLWRRPHRRGVEHCQAGTSLTTGTSRPTPLNPSTVVDHRTGHCEVIAQWIDARNAHAATPALVGDLRISASPLPASPHRNGRVSAALRCSARIRPASRVSGRARGGPRRSAPRFS
jgi:hypothetical protein